MKPHPPGAIASLVCGIFAIITGGVPVFGAVLGIVAILKSRQAMSSLQQQIDLYQPTGLPVAGLVTGIIGIVLSSLATLWMIIVFVLIGIAVSVAGHVDPAPVEPFLRW